MTEQKSNSLFSRLKSAKRLPSPPGTAMRVLALCEQDESDINKVSDVIMSDPALASRLLKFANSPSAGVGREVTSVRQAILLLGLRSVMLIALGFSLAKSSKKSYGRFDLDDFWSRSYAAAITARHVVGLMSVDADREEAFTAALLAGIGQLALAQGVTSEYDKVVEAVTSGSDCIESEREHLGLDHVEFGAQLLSEWNLPEVLVDAVKYQLEPASANERATPLAAAVQVARQLADVFTAQDGWDDNQRQVARDIIETQLGLDEQRWKDMAASIMEQYRQLAAVLDVKLDEETRAVDLYEEAQQEAARVGMVAQLEQNRAERENKALLERATTDGLTGVANRTKFDARLQQLISEARRGYGDFALLMLDVDHFKNFNDTYGHQAGDTVLKRVATLIANCVREVDLVARYGGEEFAIICPRTDGNGACILAARVCKSVANMRLEIAGETVQVTVSAGVALTSDGEQSLKAESVIEEADRQLYVSKRAGRNTWSYQGKTAVALQEKAAV